MLHTNISSTPKTYLVNDSGLAISPIVTEPSQHLVSSKLVNLTQVTPPKSDADLLGDSPEHLNIQLARDIAHHRGELTKLICNIPLAALWLLQKYGQQCYTDPDGVADNETSDADEQLNQIAESYQFALSNAECHGSQSKQCRYARLALANQLKAFPFTAEQLKAIVTTVSYAYYTKAALDKTSTEQTLLNTLYKRMQKLVVIVPEQLRAELRQLGVSAKANDSITNFLLPPDSLTSSWLQNLIATEEQWLAARQKLAAENNRLVLYLANQYKGGFMDFNDLVQEGQTGLLKAVDRFDHARGFKFSTYAVYWIRQGISRSLTRNERVVRLPFGQMATISKVHRAKEAYFNKTGTEMSIKDLALQTELSEAEVHNILYISQTATSLDTTVGDEDNATTLADFLEQKVFDHPMNNIASKELNVAINNAIQSLSDKEAKVICCRFGINASGEMTLEDIGRDLHLTRERVRQIQVTAIKKLKQHFGAELVNFL